MKDLRELERIRHEETFLCPACGTDVIMKLGQKKRWHFAHQYNKSCPYELEAETPYHQQGKTDLYYWLKKQVMTILLEHYISELKQRPDLLIKSPHHHAIEFQCATIPIDTMKKRKQGFHKLAMSSLWVLGANRLNRKSEHVFQLHEMDWQAIYSLRPAHYALLYYSPLDKVFIKLSRIIPLTKTKVYANMTITPIDSLTYQQLFLLDDRRFDSDAWLRQKWNWRCYGMKEKSPAHTYLKKMFLHHHLSLIQFPPFVGLPLKHNLLIKTPSYLWQSWIYLRFFAQQSNELISSEVVTSAFQKMFQQNVFVARDIVGIGKSLWLCVDEFLMALSQLKVIEKQGKDYIRVIPPSNNLIMEDLIKKDELILKILINQADFLV